MAEIIDLGNGYGRIEKYRSKYASLTFPLTRYEVLRLYALGVLSDDETKHTLRKMGYEFSAIKWFQGITRITTEQWKDAVNRAGTI